MEKKNVLQLLLGTVILTFLYWLVHLILGVQDQLGHYLWSLLANFLVNVVIFLLVKHAALPKKCLALWVFTIYFIIGHFNILIEAYLFDVATASETIKALASGFLVVALFAPIAVYLFAQKDTPASLVFQRRSPLSWLWRILVGDVLYLFLYTLAGFILVTVYPQLLEFYAGKIPPFGLVIKTQLLLRGFLFMAIALLMLRTIDLPLFARASLVGLTFSVFGGIAPLIPVNELMPGYVRFGHLFEVGISNFIFGWLLGYLLGQKRRSPQDP